jgi:dienelactone hydrolase
VIRLQPIATLIALLACCLTASSTFSSIRAEERIRISEKLPQTTPWDLARLSQAPKFEWLGQNAPDQASPDQTSTVRSLLFEGEPYAGKPTQVFAYYADPQTVAGKGDGAPKGPWPAVVLVHGGGGTAFREWAELWARRGYAAIAMDLAGSRPVEGANAHAAENRTRLPQGGPGQGDEEKFGSIDKPPTEQWPYHAVASVIKAHSLIRSFDHVDREKTAVTGISWGGYLTCIVSSIDSRFSAAVPVYGCGYLHDNSVWLDRFQKMSEPQRQRWVTLWDPSNYLPASTVPTFFVNGTNDFAYPLDSYMKSYSAVPGKKQIRVTVNMPHGHPPGWAPAEIGLFIDEHCRGGVPLASVSTPESSGDQITATVKSDLPIVAATLHHTSDEGPINQRKWVDEPLTLDASRISGKAPPASATALFVTASDSRDAIVSSPVVIRDSAK